MTVRVPMLNGLVQGIVLRELRVIRHGERWFIFLLKDTRQPQYVFNFAEEGSKWARGWKSRAANALRTVIALSQ